MRKKRRASRERSLQTLYAIDINGIIDSENKSVIMDETLMQLQSNLLNPNKSDTSLPVLLIEGLINQIAYLDDLIEQASENWTLKRLSVIDRNILRIAVYEMAFLTSVPPRVAINEAIEIAKLYGADNSPRFINGVLDRVYRILKRTGFNEDCINGGS